MNRTGSAVLFIAVTALGAGGHGRRAALPPPIVLTIHADRAIASFRPDRDWGAGVDGHDLRQVTTAFSPANIAAMQSAGLRSLTYRLRTELAIGTWHWNPEGRWSDAAHQQGYWVSNAQSTTPINLSFGYRLPRRGRTIDDANNDGYSRIDDGDTTSFWKTNPYLDAHFTHEPDAAHPQWFTVDLGAAGAIRDIRLLWGAPFPRHYAIDYWDGDQSLPIDDNPRGQWRRFEHGTITNGTGGGVELRVSDVAIVSRLVRVVMTESSHTAPGGNGDVRDSLGFALREVYVGERESNGNFHDLVRHDTVASQQSAILVSSTDPWHRAVDRDDETVQPGFDAVFRSGLTNRLPVLLPTGLLFDTPENAAAELKFLRSRGYPVLGIELGEEPDGQRVTPEDYGALYLQFATALRRVDRNVRLGGPSWQNLLNDPIYAWPDRTTPGKRITWIGRFLDYIQHRKRAADFQFLSFEWYPFDNVCDDAAANLAAAPGKLARDLARLRGAGLPASIPLYMTEYGYSAHVSTAEVSLPGALFDADVVAGFFAHGGAKSFYFGYEPGPLLHEPGCDHWGNLLMFLADRTGSVRDTLPRYHAARLLTAAWASPSGGRHVMHAVTSGADSLLSSYALRRPDHRWSLLLINRDPAAERVVDPRIATGSAAGRAMRGPIDVWQYSSEQYQFHEDGAFGRPSRSLPPKHSVTRSPSRVTLPPYSITVITGS